jgi:hypothetical protein
MTRLLWVICLLAPWAVASAENIHLIYFHMPPFADEVGGKATGPAVDLVRDLTAGLPVTGAPVAMPLKRLEYELKTKKTIAIGLGRNARRESLGFTWVVELFHDDYYFVTLAGHPPVTGFNDARKLKRIACNLGYDPSELHWSEPVLTSTPIWIAASPLVEPAVIDTMRRRYEEIKSQGKLDPLLAKLVQ